MSHRGFTLWFTGLPGSGKTTLATEVGAALWARGCKVELLDGDELRFSLSPELGFSRADRDLHVKRIGYLAQVLSRNGVVAIVAAISPYQAARSEVRRLHGGRLVEAYVECSLPELVRRDPKGLYAKALSGQIWHFTGISDPYEIPISPDLTICTERESVKESGARIVAALERRGLIPGHDVRRVAVETHPTRAIDRPGLEISG